LVNPAKNPSEMALRSAVSRAYYSLFHEAKSFLNSKGITIGKFNSHEQVKQELYKINQNVSRRYGNYRVDRVRADYELSSNYFTQVVASSSVSQIESLFNAIKSGNI